MKKRDFLAVTAVGASILPSQIFAQQTPTNLRTPVLLTVTGAIGKGNRGALDSALDQMMVKQKISFDKAFVFDFAAIAALPRIEINPTLEYDGKVHKLSGPVLTDVVRAAGSATDGTRFLLRATDGYNIAISANDARKYRFIVATHLDGNPMPLGGLGPLWAVYDADLFADMSAKPVNERFGLCPWGLYHIDVQRA